MTVFGKELRVGDTIVVWWSPGRDTITELRPYDGPLAHLFPEGAQLAEFALNTTGMTIDNSAFFELIARADRFAAIDGLVNAAASAIATSAAFAKMPAVTAPQAARNISPGVFIPQRRNGRPIRARAVSLDKIEGGQAA